MPVVVSVVVCVWWWLWRYISRWKRKLQGKKKYSGMTPLTIRQVEWVHWEAMLWSVEYLSTKWWWVVVSGGVGAQCSSWRVCVPFNQVWKDAATRISTVPNGQRKASARGTNSSWTRSVDSPVTHVVSSVEVCWGTEGEGECVTNRLGKKWWRREERKEEVRVHKYMALINLNVFCPVVFPWLILPSCLSHAPPTPPPCLWRPSSPLGSSSCKDDNMHCANWATQGECARNPGFMRVGCRKSCGVCWASNTIMVSESLQNTLYFKR